MSCEHVSIGRPRALVCGACGVTLVAVLLAVALLGVLALGVVVFLALLGLWSDK